MKIDRLKERLEQLECVRVDAEQTLAVTVAQINLLRDLVKEMENEESEEADDDDDDSDRELIDCVLTFLKGQYPDSYTASKITQIFLGTDGWDAVTVVDVIDMLNKLEARGDVESEQKGVSVWWRYRKRKMRPFEDDLDWPPAKTVKKKSNEESEEADDAP